MMKRNPTIKVKLEAMPQWRKYHITGLERESSRRQHTQLPLAKKNVMCKSMIAAKRKVGTVDTKPATGNEFGCGSIGSASNVP